MPACYVTNWTAAVSELLFQVLTEREETSAIAIASNEPAPVEWGSVLADPRDGQIIAAIVDRVTFNAHTLETGTQSYRLRSSRAAARREAR